MLDNELHFLLLRAFNHSNRRIDAAIRRIGLLPGQPKILECLNERDGRTAKEICAECILDKSTMTGLLTRMERKGLVRRETSKSDRRSYLVFLTEEGRGYARRVADIMAVADATATTGMDDGEQEALREGLRRIIANLERADAAETADRQLSHTHTADFRTGDPLNAIRHSESRKEA
ncbi:MarR family winged helix-turn-helix transcriptional regulator [Bifidobacterium miconisargentati]|uniref:MarR family winged helix-turn-helix transcriptional regulator n=1 Tax=Bifidobacterium miconisargentati TaxID=2834437 RepID=UPI001BDDC2AB|nr:MarR family transcriptional regulator [Bifidobacterium miconisargentati]MBW3090558.1 MarR family transcriptional regulator [Bifidobacterium miconisargentati]